jgi:hypothetical protein
MTITTDSFSSTHCSIASQSISVTPYRHIASQQQYHISRPSIMGAVPKAHENENEKESVENKRIKTLIPPATPILKTVAPISSANRFYSRTSIRQPTPFSSSFTQNSPSFQSMNNGRAGANANIPPRQAKRVNCTHVNMDRVNIHTMENQICDMCGRVPSMGWLYFCRQDHVHGKQFEEQLREIPTPSPAFPPAECLPSTPSSSPRSPASGPLASKTNLEEKILDEAELLSLGFHDSIIKQASLGQYTPKQLSTLKSQKLGVTAAIDSHHRLSQSLEEHVEFENRFPNVTVRKRQNSKVLRQQQVQVQMQSSKCALKCCHVSLGG